MIEDGKKYLMVKEVAELLGTTDKRIRNYSKHLEEAGYRFKKHK